VQINSYSFGRIVIDGKEYSNDVIIFRDEVKSWWRKVGHEVCLDDIKEIVKDKPEVLIIGTGASGCVVIKDEVKEFLKSKNIELIYKPTEGACKLFNEISKKKKIIGAFHLTC
jgi:hypothetical protein